MAKVVRDDQVRIECVEAQHIAQFAISKLGSLSETEVVPISRYRALAWASNPYADPKDVVLLVAYRNKECVGYLGLLPGMLSTRGRLDKMYWFSTWHVPSEHRKSGVGALLLVKAMSLGRDIAVTWNSPQAERVYEAFRFIRGRPLEYFEIDLANLDPLRFPYRALRKLLFLSGRSGNTWLARRIARPTSVWKRIAYALLGRQAAQTIGTIKTLRRERVMDLQARDADAGVRFFRGPEAINWMLDKPWVTTDSTLATPRLHFPDWRRLFEYIVLDIESAQGRKPLGFVVMRIDEEHGLRQLSVFDHEVRELDAGPVLLAIAIDFAGRFLADRIRLPAACAKEISRSPLLKKITRRCERSYYCRPTGPNSPLATALPDVALDLADGDCAFS